MSLGVRFGSAAAAARGLGIDSASAQAAAAASAPATASVLGAHARTRLVVERLLMALTARQGCPIGAPKAPLDARPGCGLRFGNRRRRCRPARPGLQRARCD
jgi:hypothetical protein